jgi:hypothetical protein
VPLPPDAELDAKINALFDSVLDDAAQPAKFGIVSGRSGQLQALSQRRLVIAIERAAQVQERSAIAQEQANVTMVRLEKVGIAVAVAGFLLGAIQVWVALGLPGFR